MSRPVAIAVAVVIGLFGFTACGRDAGDDAAPVTKAVFITESDDVCARFDEAVGSPLAEIFEGGRFLGIDGAATAMPQVETAIRTFVNRRQSLRPPKADADTISDVLTVERQVFDRLLSDARLAIEARDPDALGSAFDRADVGFQPIDKVQQDYGFQFCGAFTVQAPPSFELVADAGDLDPVDQRAPRPFPEPAPTASVGTRVTVRSITPCPPKPAEAAEAAGTQIRVNLWSTSTRESTRGGRILVDLTGPLAPDGSWKVEFVVPTTAIVGKHAVSARCEILDPACAPGCPYGNDLTDSTLGVLTS